MDQLFLDRLIKYFKTLYSTENLLKIHTDKELEELNKYKGRYDIIYKLEALRDGKIKIKE